MTVYLILLAVISLIGIRLNDTGDDRYLDKEHSTSLKGIFVAIILLSHFNQYITIEQNMFNYPYLLFFERIGQLMVTPFLFFSGYGVMLSIDRKKGYLNSFLKNRVIKTLIQFDLAVIFVLPDESGHGNSLRCQSITGSDWLGQRWQQQLVHIRSAVSVYGHLSCVHLIQGQEKVISADSVNDSVIDDDSAVGSVQE